MASSTEDIAFPNLPIVLSSLSLPCIILLTTVVLLAHWICRGIYRIHFHPLSRFPGPKASAFTRLPHIVSVARGKPLQYISKLHREYGDTVRISPDEVSFIDPRAWRDIYGHGSKEGKGSAPPKNWIRYQRSVNGASNLITIQDSAKHAQTRKIFTSAFSDRALTQQSPIFTKYADQLVESLREGHEGGAKFNMVQMFNFTTFDVMGDLTFGEPLHMLEQAEYDPWVKIIFKNFKRAAQLSVIYNHYPLAARIFRALLHKTAAKLQYEHLNHSATRVTKRLEKGRASEGVDLWDLVLKQEEKGTQKLTRAEMDVNAGLFMVAGTETTATLLSGLTYLLLTHPESMKKLVTELRSAFTSSDEISMEAIAALPYLNACIKEAFRRYPPVPVGLPHRTPQEGSTICGHYVPPNMTVAAPHLVMYSSPTVFKDPLSFIPERWTGDERFINDQRSALQPFSVGARDCLGKNMAYHEMRLLITKVLYNFDLELCPESKGWMENQRVYTLWQKTPLMVMVKEKASGPV